MIQTNKKKPSRNQTPGLTLHWCSTHTGQDHQKGLCQAHPSPQALPCHTPAPSKRLPFPLVFLPHLTLPLPYTPTSALLHPPFLTGDWQVNGSILRTTAKISFHPKCVWGGKHSFAHVRTLRGSSDLQDKVWSQSLGAIALYTWPPASACARYTMPNSLL